MPSTERPLLSIVIPVLNEAARLGQFLANLQRAFPDAEHLIVDGGSQDETLAIALRSGTTVLTSEPGRAAQMNLGAAAASGTWLLFLHADSKFDFTERDLYPELEAPSEAATWGFFTVHLEGESRMLPLVASMMNLRSRLTRVATGDQGLFVETKLFRSLGGFASIPLMEDVEICKRLRRESTPLKPPLVLKASGRRWDEQGAWSTILRMWGLRLAYWLGVSPERLWRYYYGHRALTAKPVASGRHG